MNFLYHLLEFPSEITLQIMSQSFIVITGLAMYPFLAAFSALSHFW